MISYQEKETILLLENVTLGYGDKVVLKDINIKERDIVREGETTGQIIAIVGCSGRGKSTLFKSITGLLKPMSGQVLINAFDPLEKSRAKIVEKGDVGFVDQIYTLFRHKTVQQILMHALRKSAASKEDKQINIDEHLVKWGLSGQKEQYPNELSGGQRQRVAFLEQVLSTGKFMVLDEPTSGLDVPGINNVKKAFRLIQQEDDLNTIIFSSHLIEFAVEMADVVYFIGQPKNETYSTIIKKFDLKELGLAWNTYGPGHQQIVEEIKNLMDEY